MKPQISRNIEIYHNGITLKLEFEQLKTILKVHIFDTRYYFPLIDTLRFKVKPTLMRNEVVKEVWKYAITKGYF